NAEAMHAIASLNNAAARLAATAERKVLSELHGGCLAPIACHAKLETSDQGTELCLRAIVMSADGKQRLQEDACVAVEPNDADLQVVEAHELGALVAKRLRDKGADKLISTVRDDH
ncbi:MAG: hydroxymethylbilane synthase, partial [bacterium]|nr:hydroxymethylbilane synthase [bacterium]